MNIILIEPDELEGDVVRLSDARCRHIRKVLKKGAGDFVRVGVVDGPRGEAAIEAVSEQEVALRCRWDAVLPRPGCEIDLVLAMPRPKVMRRLWAQLTAMGVRRLLIVNAEKVERFYFDAKALDASVIRAACIEGLQQCGDTRLPEVSVHLELKPLVEDQFGGYADKRIAVPGMAGGLHAPSPAERVLLAIGPEGGWTAYERALFVENGFVEVGMGDRILRSDTACIAAVALLRDALSNS